MKSQLATSKEAIASPGGDELPKLYISQQRHPKPNSSRTRKSRLVTTTPAATSTLKHRLGRLSALIQNENAPGILNFLFSVRQSPESTLSNVPPGNLRMLIKWMLKRALQKKGRCIAMKNRKSPHDLHSLSLPVTPTTTLSRGEHLAHRQRETDWLAHLVELLGMIHHSTATPLCPDLLIRRRLLEMGADETIPYIVAKSPMVIQKKLHALHMLTRIPPNAMGKHAFDLNRTVGVGGNLLVNSFSPLGIHNIRWS